MFPSSSESVILTIGRGSENFNSDISKRGVVLRISVAVFLALEGVDFQNNIGNCKKTYLLAGLGEVSNLFDT